VVDFRKLKERSRKAKRSTTTWTTNQQRVIDHVSGPMLAGAVAGAGKSSTLVERICVLHRKHQVPLERILLCAFNVDAAADLNKKLKDRMELSGTVEVARTLHSLAHSIWKPSDAAEGFSLDRGGTYTRAVRQGAKLRGYSNVEVDMVVKLATRLKNDCLINSAVLGLRALGRTPGDLIDIAAALVQKKKSTGMSPNMLLDVFFAAEDMRITGTELADGTRTKFVTFDDLLCEAVRLLEEEESIQNAWQQRFDHVIVDEAQDLCEAQWRIVNLIAAEHRNITIVGDPGQCVYVFRQAKPENFLNFTREWPGTIEVFMEENFRSGASILDAANVVLDMIPPDQKLPMRIKATRDISGFVGHRITDDPDTEAADIATNVLKHYAAGVDWKDQAILVRRNDQSAALELALLRAKVPTRVVRGGSFFNTKEAKAAIAYMRVIAGIADADDLEVALATPPRFLGRQYVSTIAARRESDEDWIVLMEQALESDRRQYYSVKDFVDKIRETRGVYRRGGTPLQVFSHLCSLVNWERWLDNDAEADNDVAMNFERIRAFFADFNTVDGMLTTIDELKEAQKSAASSRNAVSIVTGHSSKGLEWPVVYIAGVVDGVWPVTWSDVVDEERVFYVAVTRARDELWLNSYRYKDVHAIEETKESRFLDALKIGTTDRIGRQHIASGQMMMEGT
jgi:superfamily I DNA/RNA helicase